MNSSMREKLARLADRHEEVGALMSDPEIIADQQRYRLLSQEYAQLEPVVKTLASFDEAEAAVRDAEEMLGEADAELRALAEQFHAELKANTTPAWRPAAER